MKKMLRGVWAVVALLVAAQAAAVLPIVDNFNDGSWTNRRWNSGGSMSLHDLNGWSGACGRFHPGNQWNGIYCCLSYSGFNVTQLNIRRLMRFGATFFDNVYDGGYKAVVANRASGNDGDRVMDIHTTHIADDTWQIDVCRNIAECASSQNATPPFFFNDFLGQWVCLEMEMNSVTGIAKMYVSTQDGTFNEALTGTVNIGAGSTFNYINFVGFYGMSRVAASPTSSMYFKMDEIVIDDSYIGPPPGFVAGANSPPSIAITAPTSSATFTTTNAAVALGGTASDSDGTVASVAWANSRGGSGAATGTTSWSVATIALQSGQNVITVTATDNGGRTSTDTLTVTYNPPAGNRAPVAALSVSPGSIVGSAVTVTLNGSSSYDPDSNPLTYSWAYVSGPGNPGLTGANQAAATFSTTVQGVYTFRLTVTDTGSLSDTENAVVTVTSPWANAGPDREWPVNTDYALEGTGGSLDTAHLSFLWQEVTSHAVAIANPTSLSAGFTPVTAGTYVFRLTTTDSTGSTSDTVTITVVAATENVAPVANAGADRTNAVGDAIVLDGSASTDPNGDAITYSWVQISGPLVTLAPAGAVAYFQASGTGTYVFSLTVSDTVLSDSDTVVVVVTAGGGPSNDADDHPDDVVAGLEIHPNRSGLADLADVLVVGRALLAGKGVRVFSVSGALVKEITLGDDAKARLPEGVVAAPGVYIFVAEDGSQRYNAQLIVAP